MSVKVTALIWKMPLLLPEKLVLLRMADYADHDGGSIFPSVATVSRDCGISDRAVQLILRKFVGDGLLTIVGNETGGRGKTRHYAIDLDRAAELAGPDGEAKRAKRAKKEFALNGHGGAVETVKRVQNSAVKGEEILHPTCQGTVTEERQVVTSECDASLAGADTHGASPDFVKTTNIVQFTPPRSPEVLPLPDDWVLPEAWFDWAAGAGHPDPEAAAARFHTHWLGKRDRGDRDAANSEAVWLKHWQGWVRGDIKRGQGHGQQRHGGGQRQKPRGGLAAYIFAQGRRVPGDAEGDPDDRGRGFVRG
jgi:hypothetical protein